MSKTNLSDDAITGISLEKDFTLEEVAEALGMSTRWVRDRIKFDGAECQRYGHKIRFTEGQVAKLRAAHVVAPLFDEPITTGPSKTRRPS